MDSATSPPSYARSTAQPCPPVLLNLAPLADGTSFQVGGLLGPDPASPGTPPAAVAGEVQIKFTEGETALLDGASQQQQQTSSLPPPRFGRLAVVFKGVETDARGHQITLVEQSRTLWETSADGTTSRGAPPAVSRFRFDLTPDLPTCIHLASSSLAYSLTATLYPLAKTTSAAAIESPDDDALPLSRCVPVHLVRSATPAALVPVQSATVTATDPIRWSVRFPRTVFTRREPIGLVVRVEVPDSKRIGEGLRLRTISAELVRTITATGVESSSQSSATTLESRREADVQRRTVLAHSGKSARFSPSRPIIIRLVLHPPLEPTCESISQSTIAHQVSFSVVVTVGLVNTASTSTSSSTNFATAGASTSVSGPASTSHSGPAAHDSILTQELTILPDLPPNAAALPRSEKQKEVERDAAAAGPESSIPATAITTTGPSALWEEEHPDAPVPSYVEDLLLDPGTAATTAGVSPPPPPPMASTSADSTTSVDSPKGPALRRQDSSSLPLFTPTVPPSGYTLSASLEGYDDDQDEEEEEYDGYEELSLPASLSERPPPPRIDDDISPPSMAEPSSAFGYRLAADSGEVVIIGEEEEEEGVVRNREVGGEGSALSVAASRDGIMMGGGGGASMQEFLPLGTTSTMTDEPETPPPPVDYDLPFLSTPARLPPLPPSSLPSTPPPPPSPPLPNTFAAYPGAPSNDCETGSNIPSSPPPPLSPLDPNHHLVALPPFSSTSSPSSSAARAADHCHNSHVSRSPPPPGSGSPEGLPPPYAGRLQSPPPPPPPPATLPATSSSSSTTSSLPPTARVAVPILDAAPPPRCGPHAPAPETAGHRRYSSPRPAPSSSSGTLTSPAQNNVASISSQQQSGESPVGGVEDGTPPTEDEESRPPPYEQRDDFAASVGGGLSGIQWGMMHTTTTTTNRRGELVL
ncbi:hypothetical protein B0A53_02264 [Rhodotorula sp. CCFEE 5036]|nr:hypothetical protein B0A53_02264 [Rhodotorula sp. CCFEE 5036]